MSQTIRLVVGDGAVARALAGALGRLGEPPLRWSRHAGGVVPPAEVVVLAVRDEAIAQVAGQVMAALPEPPVLLHCAGALRGSEPFSGLSPRGAALLHPLKAFSAAAGDVSLAGTVFAVEGDEPGRKEALAIVRTVGGVPLELDGASLPRYHAAAALVSNATVGLVHAGVELLHSVGLSRAQAASALTALLGSTVRNLEQEGLPAALTGPISRGDVAVVARHVQALPAELQELYRVTALRVILVAAEKGAAAPEALAEITRLLYPNR
jgi:predicted short-subunit dehydrogenase-like oxidoreductase (DUF2520 family)